MKVLILHDYGTASGGAEHMSLMLRTRLRQRGHDVRLFTSTARPLDLPVLADDSCFGTSSHPLRHFVQVANPSAVLRLRSVLDSFRPDVVHVRMFATQLSPLILPLLRSVPSVLHVVNYNLICPKNTKTLPDGSPCTYRAGAICRRTGCVGWPGVARFAVQRRLTDISVFDAVITNSMWVRRRLEAEGIRVDGHVWNGVPVTAQRPPLSGPPSAGFAGRFVWKKGIDVAVRAWRAVVDEVPEARLLLLGDGPDRARLEQLVRESGLASNVEFLGFRPRAEAEEILSRVWVQVVPSLWEEPFGLVAAEALMRGTATIVSDSGGLSEQVDHERTGFRVPPGDAGALASALRQILGDLLCAEAFGAAARVRALRDFTEDGVVDKFEGIYERLRAGAGQGRRTPVPELHAS